MTFRVVLEVRIVYVSSQSDPTDSQSSPSRTVFWSSEGTLHGVVSGGSGQQVWILARAQFSIIETSMLRAPGPSLKLQRSDDCTAPIVTWCGSNSRSAV